MAFAQHVDPRGRRHAVADQPLSVCFAGLAVGPAKGLGPVVQCLGQFVGREFAPVRRVHIRNVAFTQFDRIDAAHVCQLVHRNLERGDTHRLARCTNRAGTHAVDPFDMHPDFTVFTAIKERRRLRYRLCKAFIQQLRDGGIMPDAGHPSISVRG